jgi:sulfate transport system substrate-binding protein
MCKTLLLTGTTVLGAVAAWFLAARASGPSDAVELLNVSYDPTRELWRDLNGLFVARHEKETGQHLEMRQSHGGSSSQARAVIDGLEADVVTLALWSDTDALRQKGLLADGWEKRLPNRSLPYYSTIVFVVHKGNPLAIHDWPDLVRPGVQVISPSAKTSGNGKLSFLAAWGSVRHRGGLDDDARAYVRAFYQHTPVLDAGARAATVTFAQKKIGDVHVTWENEAYLEVAESGGALEIIYPPASIRAEPPVAVVDAVVDRKGTRAAAEAYLKFLYTDEAQEVIARHHYRPAATRKYADRFPAIDLFDVTTATPGGWAEAQKRFFAEGGVFDQIYQPGR